MSDTRILVVDDDPDLRGLIGDFLGKSGFDVSTAADGKAMDAALGSAKFDLVVLDMMMPGEDGLSILRRMRTVDRPAIIMLSAMGEDNDRIIGLEVGADDYLAKPCNPRELLARVRAVLRRREGREIAGPSRTFGVWTLDVVQRSVHRQGGIPAALTDAEFRILNAFLDRPQTALSREALLDAAKGTAAEIYDRAIDVTVSRLRKKLGDDAPIRTIRNEGYILTVGTDR
jgi:two-component system, OmpR family, response regulator